MMTFAYWSCRYYIYTDYYSMSQLLGTWLQFSAYLSMIRCKRGGTWRTMHCRLCINCYRTGYSECVCVCGYNPPPSLVGKNLCKDDSALFSRFLHGFKSLI